MNLQALNTRETTGPVTLADGVTLPVYVGGDYFYIYALTGTLQVSVNDGSFGPCLAGLIHRGVAGRDDLGSIRFRNASGAPATITVVHGKGSMDVVGQASINNLPAEYPLPAAQVVTLTPPAEYPAPAAQVPVAANLTPVPATVDNASVLFQNCKSIAINNVGATSILVNGQTVISGRYCEFSVLRQNDKFIDVTVDATGGGKAFVDYVS